MNKIADRIFSELKKLDIIDSHEHLITENERLKQPVDVFTLFSHYTKGDLITSGMSLREYEVLFDYSVLLEERWQIFKPYWDRIKHTSFSRSAKITAAGIYGIDDISDNTYVVLSDRIKAKNKVGLYKEILSEKCKIKAVLNNILPPQIDEYDPVFKPVIRFFAEEPFTKESLIDPLFDQTSHPVNLDDYIDVMKQSVSKFKAKRVAGIKIVSFPNQLPDKSKANELYLALIQGKVKSLEKCNSLKDYIYDELFKAAAVENMTIAVHAGYWNDFRQLDPLHMMNFIIRHPNTRFDIFHLGYPWVRETLMLGKIYHNVWLNLCWTHIISQKFAKEAMSEAIDLIPANKILAFGGDYRTIEKVYGHLTMAFENISEILEEKIIKRYISEDDALEIAKMWLIDNPIELYDLKI